jgi:uncharacterized membrane protein
VITGAGPSWIERLFRIALLVKGIDGAAELIGAVILLVVSGVMVIREYGPAAEAAQRRTLTARATTRTTTTSATTDCAIIVNFAQRVSGRTSVGLNAVAFVNAR